MAWTYEQKFNLLNDDDLNGQDNWASDYRFDVQTDIKYEGAKAVKSSGDTYFAATRPIDAISAGLFYIVVRREAVSPGSAIIQVGTADVGHLIQVKFDNDGNIKAYDGILETWINIITHSAQQFYVVAIEFDDSAQPDKFRVKVHDGASWSAWTDWLNAYEGFSTISQLKLFHWLTDTYWDTITPTDPTTPPPAAGKSQGIII